MCTFSIQLAFITHKWWPLVESLYLHAEHVGKLLHLALYVQSLLDDFAQSNVETAATMVEAAGRFLYSLPETCIRMSNMLEVSTLLCCIWILARKW